MFKYIHDVNPRVEDDLKYLTDVVKLEMVKVGEEYTVTVHPAVMNGSEIVDSVPVHPKTVSEKVEVPTYTVPDTLKVLVRKSVSEIEQDTAGANHNNWFEKEIVVSPIIQETFALEEDAVKYYDMVAGQLAEGDVLRNLPVPGSALRDSYDSHNSRY